MSLYFSKGEDMLTRTVREIMDRKKTYNMLLIKAKDMNAEKDIREYEVKISVLDWVLGLSGHPDN